MNQLSGNDKTPKTARGKKTRDKLLRAAEIEFGDKGFHNAAISGITHRAGVALGTFYTYYESKEEIFHDLVTFMSHRTRRWIGERVGTKASIASLQKPSLSPMTPIANTMRVLPVLIGTT